MTLKSILVHVDNSKQAPATIAAACVLAREHDAHLTGLYIEYPAHIPGFAAIEIPASAIEVIEAQNKAALDTAREVFENTVAAEGLTGTSEWTVQKGSPVEVLALRGRYADLVVVSQPSPEARGIANEDLVDDLVLASGRPVLVIPYIGAHKQLGKRVLIGWNASREAARAVLDAMPIMEKADTVEILAVEPTGIGDTPGADIARLLARHDIKVEASATQAPDIDVGDVLLNRAADTNADLIVMGAYGHSRMRELVLGGATRHILEHMTAPVLLSH